MTEGQRDRGDGQTGDAETMFLSLFLQNKNYVIMQFQNTQQRKTGGGGRSGDVFVNSDRDSSLVLTWAVLVALTCGVVVVGGGGAVVKSEEVKRETTTFVSEEEAGSAVQGK